MKTPHHKAFEYTYEFTDAKGVPCIARNYIAICPSVDIHSLVRRWNHAARINQKYTLIGEVDLKTALYARSFKNGTSIINDWKLLDHMLFHSTTIDIQEVAV